MKKVTIVGVGALGSHVMLLARNWKVQFHLIDFDKVEQKNTQAQFHSRMGLRQNKALSLSKALMGFWGMKVKATPHKLTGDNVQGLLGPSDLVIDCTDNIAARKLIQDFCVAEDIPCLHGALSADAAFSRSVWTEHFVADPEGAPGAATCEDGEQLPFIAMASSMITASAQKFLAMGKKESYQMMASTIVRLA